MSKAHPGAPATWFRLSEESWAEIAAAYRDGATAPELGAVWRVSPSTIYARACRDGWTKKTDGDAAARAHARAIAEEERADLEGAWPGLRGGVGASLRPERVAELVPGPVLAELPDDAVDLSRAALEAAGKAMRLGRLAEAQTLVKLSETFARRAGDDAEGRLMTIYFTRYMPGFADKAMTPNGPDDPSVFKRMYWEKREAEAEAGGG